MEPQEITLLENILHGGPIIILAYLAMTVSGVVLTYVTVIQTINRRGIDWSTAFLPFPAIIGLAATSMTVVWSLPIRDTMSGISEFRPLATDLGRSFEAAFFGSSISVLLFALAMIQLLLKKK